MIRGIYTSATGMGIQQLKQETITNNLANSSTVGYKKDTTVFQSFPDMLLARLGKDKEGTDPRLIGTTNFGALVGNIVTSFKDGLLEETGNQNHLALVGEGFFVVDTPSGRRYTRDGNFTLDSEGYLVNQNGHRVVSNEGNILIQDGEFQVTTKGELIIDGQKAGGLLIQGFENPNSLRKVGQNLFEARPETEFKAAESYSLKQNHLEKPNINLMEEMVELMAVVRAYEANQKLIQAHNEMLGKSVNEIGSLK